MKKTLENRMVRTLILSMAFFLSGLAFFGYRAFNDDTSEDGSFANDQYPSIGEAARPIPSLAKYPEPSVFHQFTYARGEELTVKGKCEDEFYAVMLFHHDIDYRVSPLDARYNTAFPCEGTTFEAHIPIDTLFLEEGERYYVIKAHQGATGTWYDPY